MKKNLLLTLLLILIFSESRSQFSGGNGTENTPFLISNLADLITLSDSFQFWDSNYFYIQTNDIDASSTSGLSFGEGFKPIGLDVYEPFYGNYNGGGFKIKNLFIERNLSFNIGLFGYLGPGAVIQNLNLEDVNIWGSIRTGGIVGFNDRGIIKNCKVSGRIMGSSFVGGICGGNSRDSIVHCIVEGEIIGTGNYVGGITGINNDGIIWQCYTKGKVSSINNFVGGLVGWNLVGSNGPVVVAHSYSLSHVSGNSKVGGLVGSNEANINNAEIRNCYSNGNVSGLFEVGGIAGNNASNNGSALIQTTYSSGRISGISEIGGIAGRNATSSGSAEVLNSYFYDINLNGGGGTPLELDQMVLQGSYSGFDFFDTWEIAPLANCGLPYLPRIPNFTLINSPLITHIKSALLCSSGSEILSARPEYGILRWYDAPNGNLLHTGDTLVTPVLNQTTSYWAIAVSGNCTSEPKEIKASLLSQHGLSSNPQAICSPQKVNIILNGSEEKVLYYLRDADSDTLISGPFTGSGDTLVLESETVHSNMNFKVYGKSIPTFKAEKGTALKFDGVNNFVSLGNDASYRINKGTLETWFKIPASGAGAGFRAIIVKENAFGIFTNSNILVVRDFTCGCIRNTNIPVNDDKWHHVAMVFDSAANNMDLYLDGVQVLNNRPFNILNQHSAITLAAGNPTGTTQNLHGELDETKIWNITKTQQEIQDGMYACLEGNEPGLVAYFNYEDGSGSGILSNKVQGAPNGSLTNMNISTSWQNGFVCESCEITMNQTASVVIIETPDPPTALDSQSFCFSARVNELQVNGQDIRWYSASQGGENLDDSISLEDARFYYASQTLNGCESVLRYPVWTNIHSVNVEITQEIDTLFALAENASFQWLDCSQNYQPILNETAWKFAPTLGGTYAVSVTQNNCVDTSECIFMQIGSVFSSNEIAINIFPNPVFDKLNIHKSSVMSNLEFKLYNNMGALIQSGFLKDNITVLCMQDLSSGIYFLKIEGHENHIFKFMKD